MSKKKQSASIQRFEQTLATILEKHPDVTDIQFVGNGQIWVNEYQQNVPSGLALLNQAILKWADDYAGQLGGGNELKHGDSGTLEKAITLGDKRLRLTFRRQRGGFGLDARVIDQTPPGLDSPMFATNPIPQALVDAVLNNSSGMILFGGATGSGKSTLQAALVDAINSTKRAHIYTVEDPIEYVHTSKQSLITQRELHLHVDSFEQGLLTAKRSKPDVVLIGELRGVETMRAALDVAGEGHLVLATVHASSAHEAISTFIGQFPTDEQNQTAVRLAESLHAVVIQKFVPDHDLHSVVARELLMSSPPLKTKIREKDFHQIHQVIGHTTDSFTLDSDLVKLAKLGTISHETAIGACVHVEEVKPRLAQAAR